MPKVSLVLYEIRDKTGASIVAKAQPFDDISDYALKEKLPRNLYHLQAPYIGRAFREIGVLRSRSEYMSDLIAAIQSCIELGNKSLLKYQKDALENKIINHLKIYEISSCIIYQLYINLTNNHLYLGNFRGVFTFLVNNGASWEFLPFPDDENNLTKCREIFSWLINNVLGGERATGVLSNVVVGDPPGTQHRTGYGYFIEVMDYFLALGANLNGVSRDEPGHGSFLHRYLANELPLSTDLIHLLESKRLANKPHTQFDYTQQDAQGKTPLIIAIATRNIAVIKCLLQLNRTHHIDIGINIPDQNGRTPLMLACAFGLSVTVADLLEQHADPKTIDFNQKTYLDYLTLTEKEEWQILSMMVHPERGASVKHSYLFAHDTGYSPLCLYEDKEEIISGEEQLQHFVVLSPLEKHQTRIEKVARVLLDSLEHAKKLKDTALVAKITKDLESIAYQQLHSIESKNKTFLTECRAGRSEISYRNTNKVGNKVIGNNLTPTF